MTTHDDGQNFRSYIPDRFQAVANGNGLERPKGEWRFSPATGAKLNVYSAKRQDAVKKAERSSR
jgi:hypothetical protein